MSMKKTSLIGLSLLCGFLGNAQQLSRKIPADAKFVVTVNQNAIIQNASEDLLNEILAKSKFKINGSNGPQAVSVSELGMDLQKDAFVYYQANDSIKLTGVLLPLNGNQNQVQNLLDGFTPTTSIGEYTVLQGEDSTTKIAYNSEYLLYVNGSADTEYFYREDVRERYGIVLEDYNYGYDYDSDVIDYDLINQRDEQDQEQYHSYDYQDIEARDRGNAYPLAGDFVAQEEQSSEVHVHSEECGYSTVEVSEDYQGDPAIGNMKTSEPSGGEYDSYYSQEEDLRSSYLDSSDVYSENQRIENELEQKWFDKHFAMLLDPENNMQNNKEIILKDNHHLVRLWVANVDAIYAEVLPTDIMSMPFGFDLSEFKYGYQKGIIDLLVKDNVLALETNLQMEKDLANSLSKIYDGKLNNKFKKYIPQDHLGYFALNFNMQGYLEQLPQILGKRYGGMFPENAELFNLIATSIDIAFDQKALAQVLAGDMIVFINDFDQTTVTYTDYSYDEDYNWIEEEKTKEEFLPSFLAMVTSKDQRLFKMGLDLALSKEEVTKQGSLYKIPASSTRNAVYILFKQDMIFLGTDLQQITQIEQDNFKTNTSKQIKKQFAGKWGFNAVLQTPKLSQVLVDLDVPATKEFKGVFNDLPGFGALQIVSGKGKNNSVYANMTLGMPKKDNNALAYVLQEFLKNLN